MFLVQMILLGKFKYWLARKEDKWFWTGLRNSAFKFENRHIAEDKGKTHSKVDFTIEKIIE